MVTSTHIVKLLDIITDNNFCYIVTEECPRGTLRDYIKQKGILAEEEALNILRQILIGCTALTEKCIIHRDLKPENIMLRANGEAVIIDLGYC